MFIKAGLRVALICGAIIVVVPVAAQAETYTATTISSMHGALDFIDSQCHEHGPSDTQILPTSPIQREQLDEAQHGMNVVVKTHWEDGAGSLETVDTVASRSGTNYVTHCASQNTSFATHVDGTIAEWFAGNASGGFLLNLSGGATKRFSFTLDENPPVNGRELYCSPEDCAAFHRVIQFNKTKVRVYFKVIESPDGPREQVEKVQTL